MISSTLCRELQKTIVDIPISRINPNPYQPRRHFDKAALMELAESIKQYGVIQPITVRKRPDGEFELVSGERRFRASNLAGKKTIPAIIVNIKDNDSAMIALLENLQRRDLTFFEEAEGYAFMIEEYGLTQEELAEKIGKNQSTIANKLRLLKIDKPLRDRIFEANLSERHARVLLRLSDTEAQTRILDAVISKKLNVSKTEALVNKTLIKAQEKKRYTELKSMTQSMQNYKVICNTINQALGMIKKSGFLLNTRQSETQDSYEFVITIAK